MTDHALLEEISICLLCNQNVGSSDPSLCKTHRRIYRNASRTMQLLMGNEMAREKMRRNPENYETEEPKALVKLLAFTQS